MKEAKPGEGTDEVVDLKEAVDLKEPAGENGTPLDSSWVSWGDCDCPSLTRTVGGLTPLPHPRSRFGRRLALRNRPRGWRKLNLERLTLKRDSLLFEEGAVPPVIC